MPTLRGRVARVDADGRPHVEVPSLAAGYAFGPLEVAAGTPALVAGDRVVVATMSAVEEDLVVIASLGAGDEPIVQHTHHAADINTGVLELARLPVAPSGNANPTQIVRADDARLSNARTPTSHSHTMGDLPAAAAALAAYPVGAFYISAVSTSPATLFGGTWTQVSDRMLIAIGSNARWDSALETGGSETVALTAAQSGVPAHGHGVNDPGHFHSEVGVQAAGVNSAAGANYGVLAGPIAMNTSSKTTGVTVVNNAAANASQAHDNMPPFIAVYMWRRTG